MEEEWLCQDLTSTFCSRGADKDAPKRPQILACDRQTTLQGLNKPKQRLFMKVKYFHAINVNTKQHRKLVFKDT